jgi:predicted ATPase
MLENQQKIALVGTSCIGKSTIFEHFKHIYAGDKKVSFVEEAARNYFTQNSRIPVDNRFSFQPQSEIQALALQAEQAAHSSGSLLIITDRSTLDAAAYVRAYGDIQGSRTLVERVRLWLPTYSSILLLNPEGVTFQQDDIRQEDENVRQRNHHAFVELFEEEGVPYELVSGTLEQRIKRVNEIILYEKYADL